MSRCLYTHFDGYPVIPKHLVRTEKCTLNQGPHIEKPCALCGKKYPCAVGEHKRGARFCSKLCQYAWNSGANNALWKGDLAKAKAGRARAKYKYTLTECIICGVKATDRHHKDGNTLNNTEDNVMPLCRKCHMSIDGRLKAFKEMKRTGPIKSVFTTCSCCGVDGIQLRKGRCPRCDSYYRKHGKDRIVFLGVTQMPV